MHVIRIDHVSLNLSDRPQSIAWYQDILGLDVGATPRDPSEPAFAGPDGAQLGLFADRAPGLRHIALATDEVSHAAVQDRLQARGIRFRCEWHGSRPSTYFADPDGHMLELFTAAA